MNKKLLARKGCAGTVNTANHAVRALRFAGYCLGAVALFVSAGLACAQTGLATLTGTVTDQSGAVMPGVSVLARHTATGTALTGVSSQTGNFTISQMPIGAYEIEVAHAGFKTYRRDGLTLSNNQTLRLEIGLEVGTQAESVTITAEASLMKTDSGQVVHNITMREIQNLPITPVGGAIRDPFSVAQLMPGVRYVPLFDVNGAASFGGAQMLINGLPTSSVQYRIEGQVMGNSRSGFTANTQQVQPSVDAIQEVSVITSNYNAEYGSVAGALFNVTMRGGSNQYHGSAYDYVVNEMLNAHDNAVHLRDKLRRHDWGVTIGGPVNIPKLYQGRDKTFFFFGWELYQQKQVAVVSAGQPTVPIQAYRDGDFSGLTTTSGNRFLTLGSGSTLRDYVDPLGQKILAGTLFDPRTTTQVTCNTAVSQDCGGNGAILQYRTPFPGNRVPTNLMDPVALAIQNKYIPLPKGPRADSAQIFQNYQNPFQTNRTSIIPSIKIDQNIDTKRRLSGYWQMTKTEAPRSTNFGAEGLPDLISSNRGTYQTNWSFRLNYDETIAAGLQLHIGGSWTQFEWADNTIVTDFDPAAEIGLNGVRLARNFPRFAANTQTNSAGVSLGGMTAMGPAAQGQNPERRPAGQVSLTWIKGNHTMKFGSEWRMDMLPTISMTNANGSFGALGNGITWQPSLQGLVLSGATNVGFPYAEFLMGSVRGFSMSTPIVYRTSKHQWGLYLQDTWRLRRNFTLDYGLRWDYGTYTKEDYGRNAGLSLTEPNPSAAGRPGALIYEATCKCQFAKNYPYGIGPRIGFAYTLNQKTVFRGGFGVSYGTVGEFGGFAQNSAAAPSVASGFDNFKMRDGIPSSINPQWPVFDAGLGHPIGQLAAPRALLDPNAGRPSRTYQWNISLQREITRDLVVEASYIANRGVWQDAGSLVDFNAVSEQTLRHYGFTVGNLDDATLLNTRWSNLSTAQRSTLQNRGVGLPYSNFPVTGTTAPTVLQSIRQFPQFLNAAFNTAAINPSSAPLGKSWYDALQIQVTKRYSKGLQVNANYTWGKNLNARTVDDVFNRDYGTKDIDGNNLPWRVRISAEYQTPKPQTSLPVLGNKYVAYALGGWGIAFTVSYQSAFYMGRPSHGATNPISRWLGRGPGGAQLKKDADGKYMNPWSVNWIDYDGKQRTDPIDINCGCFDPRKTIVLNPAAWEAVPDAQWAAQNQVFPWFRGIRLPQEAANIQRNFRFGPEGKYTLQIRAEFQNVTNRSKLPPTPSIGVNFQNPTYQTSTDPRFFGNYTSGFGTFGNLNAANSYGAERTGMLVGRFTF